MLSLGPERMDDCVISKLVYKGCRLGPVMCLGQDFWGTSSMSMLRAREPGT